MIWVSFRGANLEEVLKYARESDWSYLGLMFLSGLFSHVFRAIRWQLLLKPLTTKRISVWNAFSAIMYGYAANLLVPRGGEVVRLFSITKTESLPLAGVLSTLLIDRLLDVAVLMLLLGATLTILPPSITTSMPWLLSGGAALSIVTILALVLMPFFGRILAYLLALKPVAKLIPPAIEKRLDTLISQFNEGTKAITNPITYPAIALLSIVIWVLYWLNFYLVIKAFRLADTVSLMNSLIVFTVGSVGVLLPTPGSIGSFHFLVSQALMLATGVSKDVALSYASTLHALAFVVVPCPIALACIAINLLRQKKNSLPES